MAVIDDEGNEVAPGEEGEKAVKTHPERPVGLFKEYWKNEEATPGASATAGTTLGTSLRGTRTATTGSWGAPTT